MADSSAPTNRTDAVNTSLILPDVTKMSDQEAEAVINQVAERLYALRQNALIQLKQPNLGSEQKASLYRLAAGLQVYEAMDIMINDIAFTIERKNDPFPSVPLPPGVSGPVAQELLPNFGLPAFHEIMEMMSDNKKDVPFVTANTNAYAWVLWAIEGKRYSLIRLQDRLAKEKSPKVQAQYQKVIDGLKVYPNTD